MNKTSNDRDNIKINLIKLLNDFLEEIKNKEDADFENFVQSRIKRETKRKYDMEKKYVEEMIGEKIRQVDFFLFLILPFLIPENRAFINAIIAKNYAKANIDQEKQTLIQEINWHLKEIYTFAHYINKNMLYDWLDKLKVKDVAKEKVLTDVFIRYNRYVCPEHFTALLDVFKEKYYADRPDTEHYYSLLELEIKNYASIYNKIAQDLELIE